MKLAIQELDHTIKCKSVSPINNKLKSELVSTIKNEAQNIISHINDSKNFLEVNLYIDGKLDLFSIEEKEIEVQIIIRMNYWKMTFEDCLAKVSLPIYQTQKFSEDAIIDEAEYVKQKTKVDNAIGDKARFYQSLKRLEDISINEYYDNEAKKISENLKNNSAKVFSVNNSETAATDENNHNGSDSGNETVVMGDEEYFSESMPS